MVPYKNTLIYSNPDVVWLQTGERKGVLLLWIKMTDASLKKDLLLHLPQFEEAFLRFKHWEVRWRVYY